MKRLLLTGYEPFLDFKVNPTEEVVRELDGQVIGEYHITGRVYPVVFKEIKSYIEHDIDEVRPDAVINLGLAGNIHTIDLERIAINLRDGKKDNSGFKPDGEKIELQGPDGMFSTLPIKDIEHKLKEKQIPVRITNSAGTYLCNNLMYSTLFYLKNKNLNIPAGFIHVPENHEIGVVTGHASWSQNDITKAVKTVIQSL